MNDPRWSVSRSKEIICFDMAILDLTSAPRVGRPDVTVVPDDVPRPVSGLSHDYPSGWKIPRHHHRKAQLVYASGGVMTVTTGDGTWVVPPQRAVWVPGFTDHGIAMSGVVRMRTLYLSREAAAPLPTRCCVVAVSPLLLAFLLFQRQFVQSFMHAGIK